MIRKHMWKRISMMGLIEVQCGRKVKATRFTDQPELVTCIACLKRMKVKQPTVMPA